MASDTPWLRWSFMNSSTFNLMIGYKLNKNPTKWLLTLQLAVH